MPYRRRNFQDDFAREGDYPSAGLSTRAYAEPTDGADLRQFISILGRHRAFIAIATFAALGLAAVYILLAATTYTATVSILIDARMRAPLGADSTASSMSTPDVTLVESQVKLIASDTVLRRVAQRERLFEDPDFVPTRPGLRTRLFAMLGLGGTNVVNEDRLTRATTALARLIAVKRSEKTYVIDVDVVSGDANKSARLANMVAEAYITDQRDARMQISKQDSQWLQQRLTDLQGKVQDAENRVQEYKVKNQITDAVGKNTSELELSDLTNELGKSRTRTIEAKSRYEQLQKLSASGRLNEATADALKSPVLEKLRVQYAEIVRQEAHYRTTLGERHPAMLEVQNQLRDARQLIAAEIKRVADSANNEYQQARIAEAETLRRVETARKSTESKNGNGIQLRELERELEAHRLAYEKFLRARETGSDDSNDGLVARVIAPASAPLAPSAPKVPMVLFIALLSGLCIGAGGALLHEYLAMGQALAPPTPDYGSRFDSGMSLHVIGYIPRIRQRVGALDQLTNWLPHRKSTTSQSSSKHFLNEFAVHPDSPFSMAIGSLLDTLEPQTTDAHHGATTVLISSLSARCGKTTIAVNLARAAAATGQRTLLIDANFTHPGLDELIGAGAQPGLIELSGAFRPIYPIGEGAQGDLRVVPILGTEEHLCAKLARQRTTTRLSGIRDNFDFVVIDGPVLDGSESLRLVANAVNAIVFVAGPGEPSPSIDELVEALDIPEDKLVGAVASMSEARLAA